MRRFDTKELESLALELPEEIQQYKLAGNFDMAKEAIQRWLLKPIGEKLKERLRYEQYILEELPKEFPYTEQDIIKMFQEKLPDFSAEDLHRIEQDNLAEWIYLNGEKHYIHNLLRNICDKDDDIKERMGSLETITEDKKLLLEKVKEIQEKKEVTEKIHLRASIRLNEEQFCPGMKVKVHLPIPAEWYQTSDVEILDYSEGKVSIDDARSLYRSICIEDTLKENRTFYVEYQYKIKSTYIDLWNENSEHVKRCGTDWKLTKEEEKTHLGEQYPHIRFSPYLRALAEEIVGDEKRPLEIARKIYDYITTNVQYSYMKAYALIPDIPQYCARNLRGDCGVQALLFITLCRICGVPAQWQSGLYANPKYVGPHDWAMFYVEEYGWLYADPSFGGSAYASGDENRRRFYFGNLDPYRMTANHAFQQEFAVKKEFMPIDPYDNQSGEIESETKGFASYEVESDKEWLE